MQTQQHHSAPRGANKRRSAMQNALMDIIRRHPQPTFTENELQTLTGWKHTEFKQTLNTLLQDPSTGVHRNQHNEIINPTVTQLTAQAHQLLNTIFKLQEITREWEKHGEYTGISDSELYYRSKLSREQYEQTRDYLLEHDPSFIKTPTGGYAVTW